MEKGSVSVYFVQSALEQLRALNVDTAPLLVSAGIAPALLDAPNGRVTPQGFSNLWLGVATALDDELFGQDRRRMKPGSFAMLTYTLIGCGTLRSALQRMVRCFNLLLDDFHCALEMDDRHARLVLRQTDASAAPRVFGFETLLMMQHGLACWLIKRRIPVLAAAFSYAEPPRSAEYRLMYSENMLFEQEVTALSFDQHFLDLPVMQNQQSAKAFLRGAPANIVLKYKNSSGLAAQIRRRLRAAARTKWPDFDALAASLHMAPSTLRRRLDDEGQTYQLIKDQLRRDMAIDFLFHSSRSVAEIAAELGFAESSAFHRAFKKWTGVKPGAYRQRTGARQQPR
jgi:AraC-like DNA-binding protein